MGNLRDDELLRADTSGSRGRRIRTDHPNSHKNVEYAEAADRSAKSGMQQNAHQRREMAQKIVLLPNAGPWEIEEDSAHDAANNHQQRAYDSIHACETAPRISEVDPSMS